MDIIMLKFGYLTIFLSTFVASQMHLWLRAHPAATPYTFIFAVTMLVVGVYKYNRHVYYVTTSNPQVMTGLGTDRLVISRIGPKSKYMSKNKIKLYSNVLMWIGEGFPASYYL